MSNLLDTLLVLLVGAWAVHFLWRRYVRRKSVQGSSCGRCDGASCPSRKA